MIFSAKKYIKFFWNLWLKKFVRKSLSYIKNIFLLKKNHFAKKIFFWPKKSLAENRLYQKLHVVTWLKSRYKWILYQRVLQYYLWGFGDSFRWHFGIFFNFRKFCQKYFENISVVKTDPKGSITFAIHLAKWHALLNGLNPFIIFKRFNFI